MTITHNRLLVLLAASSVTVVGSVGAATPPTNASHEAEAAEVKPPRDAKESSRAAAAREADRAAGKTRTTPKTASADAENPGVGESTGDASDIAKKAAAAPAK